MNTGKIQKEKTSITVDKIVIEEIKQMAKEDDRSVSQYINLVLKNHLQKAKAPLNNN